MLHRRAKCVEDTVTAEVASSSLVVPAILFSDLVGSRDSKRCTVVAQFFE
jgi:hypothetical protein